MTTTRRIGLLLVALLIAIPLAGAVYERSAQRAGARQFPPPGTLVDVGGHRLHLLCIGSGAPTVIFEAAGFANSMSSEIVRTTIARETTVCSYDRRGVAWSDPSPDETTIGMLAEDLRTLQDRAALASPFVIVTASMGGLITEMFARRYPERTAGLVFLDAANSELLSHFAPALSSWKGSAVCAAAATAGWSGAVRLFDPFGLRSSEDSRRSAALIYGAKPWNAICALVRGIGDTEREFAAAPSLRPGVPLAVLTAGTTRGLAPPMFERWVEPYAPMFGEAQLRLAQRSAAATWQLVPGGEHLLAGSHPEVVVDAVRGVIRRATPARAVSP